MKEVAHRSYPIPSRNWIMRQTWNNLLFLHWPISPKQLQPFIPSPLQIDIFNQYAWIGIIVFCMGGIYPRGFSLKSLTPKFKEINVRTYVLLNGKPGVYFLSLDVPDWASLTIAKRWYHLPYHPAKVSIQKEEQTFHCLSIRNGKANSPISFNGKFKPISEVFFPQEGTLEHWLTERYCLYSTKTGDDIYCGEIHHRPWPLQIAEAEISHNTMFSPFEWDLSDVKPISHYAEGMDTLIWNIKRVNIPYKQSNYH